MQHVEKAVSQLHNYIYNVWQSPEACRGGNDMGGGCKDDGSNIGVVAVVVTVVVVEGLDVVRMLTEILVAMAEVFAVLVAVTHRCAEPKTARKPTHSKSLLQAQGCPCRIVLVGCV